MTRPGAYRGDAPYVFACYSHEDKVIVYKEIAWLQQQSINVWYDEGISPGHEWSEDLGRAIGQAQSVLAFVTPAAVASRHCRNEVHFAQSRQIPVLALHLKPTALPPGLELALSSSQAVLAHELPKSTYRRKIVNALNDLGARTHEDTEGSDRVVSQRMRSLPLVMICSLIVASVLAAVGFWLSRGLGAVDPTRTAESVISVSQKSIAVLPFTDMSQDRNSQYLADGMAEEIINLLAQVPGLLVPARTSSFYFRDADARPSEVARQLGVNQILQGSIRRAGDRLRVTAQLLRAENEFVMWSATYDRELRDVFEVQDDIAQAVVTALQIRLMGGELDKRAGGTQNLEAYELYLRGLSAIYENTESSLKAAIGYLEQATKLDPEFGMAWSGLAFAYIVMTDSSFIEVKAGYGRARELARHALQVSPRLVLAHACLQYVYRTLDFDWAAAKAEGRLALTIDATNPDSLHVSGALSNTFGQWDEAEALIKLALKRDPLNTLAINNLGQTYYGAGRFDEAEATFRRVLELAPDFFWGRAYLAKTLLAAGRPESALSVIQDEPDELAKLMFLPVILHANGQTAEADKALQAQALAWGNLSPYLVAISYAGLRDADQAMEWLERAYAARDPTLTEIVGEPLLTDLVDDPRFIAFLRKMKLPTVTTPWEVHSKPADFAG